MTAEKMIIVTGKQYLELKQSLESGEGLTYNIGTDKHPEMVKITNIYMDTDPDFTRNPRQFARMHEDLNVQVKLEYVTE
ncbi:MULTISPECIES: hypothetical protein [Mucilaginibacter]|jgi:hypothetical protein|uniref:Uncharacterized protein n=1 Tax=Mucilaginibacter gossypii TaxID=551996 RepID=A0A1G8MNF7_9SPHI|nr:MULTISPECIES: hypothetical protein [Mucilaginibacter]GGB19849.1 hypothetical protein GCM10011500_39890 [Mucilaginibacter rubeus]SDI69432.1 hypothetical protein SAMN05192573_12824 [Mucilaginibacter gossypii]